MISGNGHEFICPYIIYYERLGKISDQVLQGQEEDAKELHVQGRHEGRPEGV